jgi:uncharacterized protein (DUF1778 family)
MTTELRKVGRPTLASEDVRSALIKARVTLKEQAHIKDVAKLKGLTMTQLILLGIRKVEEEMNHLSQN